MAKFCGQKPSRPAQSDDAACRLPNRIVHLPVGELNPDPRNARRHPAKQIQQLARIIEEFGWSTAIVIDECSLIIAGHARLEAAKLLGLTTVPCIALTHLTASQKKALAIADNAMTDGSSFDDSALRSILAELDEIQFDLDLTGLDPGLIDFHLDGPPGGSDADPADILPDINSDKPAISRVGDLWLMGPHRLYCGDALAPESYWALLGDERAAMVITDPPYNVRINGHVSGLGRRRHREFAMTSGEMTRQEFRAFLDTAITRLIEWSESGSIHFVFMDWRHIADLIETAEPHYSELKNICAWIKTNGGMGSLYRSQHELVAVFKKGAAPHINNVQLGRHGRNRSNVWEYAGANAFGRTRDADLEAHPVVKPVSMIADAIRDCSNRGDLVVDPFGGSGVTILACERSGRRAAAMEIDPRYVDLAIRRWETLTGKAAVLDGDGRTFKALEAGRGLLALEDHSRDGEPGR